MKKQSVDFNGIGQAKAKAVKKFTIEEPVINHKTEKQFKENNKNLRKAAPVKKEKAAKETQTIKRSTTNTDTFFRKNLTENFMLELKNEYNLSSFNVYYAADGDFPHKLCGDELENELVIERYLAYMNPVVLVNPNGITDNREYKSRYVTRVYINDGMYLICI